MADFKTIETQEELDNIIKSRLERQAKTVTEEVTKKFEGYISPDEYAIKSAELDSKINELTSALAERDNSIAELTAKATAYERNSVKTRIANEFNIPLEFADRLTGENEEELKADAEKISKFITVKKVAPLGSTEGGATGKNAAYSKLISGLND